MLAPTLDTSNRSLFEKGTVLKGQQGTFTLTNRIGEGRSGETWEANDVGDNPVIVKLPLLDPDELTDTIVQRLADLTAKFHHERAALTRLAGLECAAEFIDYGLHNVMFSGEPVAVLFMVQRRIHGVTLDRWLAKHFPSEADNEFHGIPHAAPYFKLALQITRALLQIHQSQVVHGDIWIENIMVERDDKVVFIDFGEALLHEQVPPNKNGSHGVSKRMVAPEGSGSVCADIYSLGGVFFTIATGEPVSDFTGKTIDELKDAIAEAIRNANPSIYMDNRGIVDVIARMLRYHQAERSPNADAVLRDLETFCLEASCAWLPQELAQVTLGLQRIESNHHDLFLSMASRAVRTLSLTIAAMARGVYDLSGTHEDIVAGLTAYLATLRHGDCYLTVTVPSFWSDKNIGTNGRYLSMNILAAQRGATIRRIFILTEDDDPALVTNVVAAHLHTIAELDGQHPSIQTRAADLGSGGFYTGFIVMSRDLAQAITKLGRQNYGLLLKGKTGLLMVPVYRHDNVMTTLQFRSERALIEEFRRDFDRQLKKSQPLIDYRG